MSFFMKLAQTEEYRMAIKITQMNLQLTEALHSHLELMIRQCKKLGIEFPDLDVTIELMNKEKELVNRISSIGLSPEMKRPQDSPVEETEPDSCAYLKGPQFNFYTRAGNRCLIKQTKLLWLRKELL